MTSDHRPDIIKEGLPPTNGLWEYEYEGVKYPHFLAADPAEHLPNIRNMKCEPDDTIICSYPRSGSHWVLEVASMLIRRRTTHSAQLNSLDIIPAVALDGIPSPRIFKTHFRFHQLPEQFRKNRSKVIYCIRNPKDVAVSVYNLCRSYRDMHYSGTWDQFLKEFCKGNVAYSSWFDNVKSFEKVRESDNTYPIHFVYYEEMKKDPEREIKRLAKFLDMPLDKHTLETILDKTSIESMRKHQVLYYPIPAEYMDPNLNATLFRKGVVGEWKNWFTKDQNHAFDKVYDEKMKGSRLSLKFQLLSVEPLVR